MALEFEKLSTHLKEVLLNPNPKPTTEARRRGENRGTRKTKPEKQHPKSNTRKATPEKQYLTTD